MDGAVPDSLYLEERRRRLAAERTLEHTRRELARAHSALVSNADRLSRGYLAQRDHNLKLSERQHAMLERSRNAAEKADRARRRLWHALETMRDGFALFDRSGVLIAANHVWLDLFDAASEIAPGAHATEIFGLAAEEGAFDIGDLSPEEWAREQVARWDAPTIETLVLHHYDGRVVRFQDRRAPDGDVVSLAIDMTEHQEREQSLAAARDAAESLARAKADFLARMSHEIRTPMNGVLGMSQMLIDESTDAEAKLYAQTIHDSAEALLVIVNDTLDVSKLEAGKVELRSEDIDLEAVLIDCIRLAAVNAAENVNVGLFYPLGAQTRFFGDGGRLRQVVMNLLGNALKFTSEGHVVLRASLHPGDPFQVVLTVEDTGPGIAKDKQAVVFDAFGQVDDPSRPVREGTGLGLTISRGLAEKMGGTLGLASELGKGSVFTLTLPLEPGAAPEALPPLPTRIAIPKNTGIRGKLAAERLVGAGVEVTQDINASVRVAIVPLVLDVREQQKILDQLAPDAQLLLFGRRNEAIEELAKRADSILPVPVAGADVVAALLAKREASPTSDADMVAPAGDGRILLADDNATNRLLLERMLKDQACPIELVADGAAALAAVKASLPSVVVLDISMPVMDGFEAAAAIRAHVTSLGLSPIPIIAVTAHVGDDMEARLKEARFDAYLTKPLKKDLLLAELERLMPRGLS
ncbi:ATP-binding protein [Jannaschia pohangensis]|uniref:histidine kinase n=1 Tax=Jannaschia pohangensis TaxID=390807 RepID=A0A1I3NT05_9RHOB|nr:ATP-binding protein [Jannaschia pohangensis]SFJ12415.1 histidine kinase [Jannaschia pohangensis]